MLTNSPFSILGLGIVAVVAAAVCFVAVASSSDRDGLLYKIASRAIFPITKSLVAPPNDVSNTTLNESLKQMPVGWSWYQKENVDVSFGADGLVMVPTRESVWYKNKRAPVLFTHLTGDFDASVSVKTRKRSQPEDYPDQAYQIGGLLIRDPRGAAWLSREEYVFVGVGYRVSGLKIESKSTFNGYSDVFVTDWNSGDAKLRIRRMGDRFELFASAGDDDKWRKVKELDRDLPDTVQVGLFSYAYSAGKGIVDVVVQFKDLQILPPVAQSGK